MHLILINSAPSTWSSLQTNLINIYPWWGIWMFKGTLMHLPRGEETDWLQTNLWWQGWDTVSGQSVSPITPVINILKFQAILSLSLSPFLSFPVFLCLPSLSILLSPYLSSFISLSSNLSPSLCGSPFFCLSLPPLFSLVQLFPLLLVCLSLALIKGEQGSVEMVENEMDML